MAFRKYAQGEGKIKPIVGDEADVLVKAMRRTGKFALSEFTEGELDELDAELERRREAERSEEEHRAVAEKAKESEES